MILRLRRMTSTLLFQVVASCVAKTADMKIVAGRRAGHWAELMQRCRSQVRQTTVDAGGSSRAKVGWILSAFGLILRASES